MRFPSMDPGSTPQSPEQKMETTPKPLTLAQEARKEAIAKLQKDLREKADTTPPLVQAARLKALVTLLSNEVEEELGVLVSPDMMHYTDHEPASNESSIEEDKIFG
jgi:hypothetical protein